MEKKKTNKRQFACLVAYMEQHPELAKGSKFVSSRESVTALWWTVTDSLNSLGPPTRSVASWQKVWTDKKLQLKRKLQHNRNELTTTGGGPNTLQSFKDLEETIIRLVSLERAVNHNGSVFGVPPNTDPPINEKPIEEMGTEATVMEEEPTHANTARESNLRGLERATKRNFRKVLLEKQTDDLCKIKRHVSSCAYYSRKSYELQTKRFALEKKRFDLAEDKFRFKKQIVLENQKHKSEQLQYQLQLLEYKKQKLNFDMGRTTRNTDAPDDHAERDEDDSDD